MVLSQLSYGPIQSVETLRGGGEIVQSNLSIARSDPVNAELRIETRMRPLLKSLFDTRKLRGVLFSNRLWGEFPEAQTRALTP